ncbi:MAG: PolC-type DNA polymerase III [Solobacterium sp.]|nr:PolC-type DNA polymerase III [Solobacterium sp.]
MSKCLTDVVASPKVKNHARFHEIQVEKAAFYREENRIEMELHSEGILSFNDYALLQEALQKQFGCLVNLHFHVTSQEITQVELSKYLDHFYGKHPECKMLSTSLPKLTENELQLIFASDEEMDAASACIEKLSHYLNTIGFSRAIHCHLQESHVDEIPVIDVPVIKEAAPEVTPVVKRNFSYGKKKDSYTKIELKDIKEPIEHVMFTGDIFAKEDFEIRSNHRIIQSLSVYDGTDAMIVKRFEGPRLSKEELEEAKIGDRYEFYGSFVYDSFAKDLVFNTDQMVKVNPLTYTDEALEKRVELHMHTNMSEMDGVCDAGEVISHAWKLGHEGIVITDHADVQSFVKAYNTAEGLKKKDPNRSFKVGFGCEMNVVDDHLNIVYHPDDTLLQDTEYVCYDLETTGLSCYFDHIIEFGAVKMKNQAIVDRLQMFIKPPVPIPAYIAKKTNITNEMVKDAKPIEEAIDTILEFLGDAVLVAHNATFDYYFLNEELRRMGRAPMHNKCIDTLDLARAILKDRRVYRLGSIARNYRIAYDEEIAHRADYDAEVLSGVFLSLLNDAQRKGAKTLLDLQNNIQDEDAYKKVRRSHTIVLAKNREGLKRLYQLVTLSNTETLAVLSKGNAKDGGEVPAEPRVLRSAIDKDRTNILIGSSCQNNELFELACNGDDARLEKAMKWYDYIEIQPLDVYSTYILLGNCPDEERLKQVLLRLIHMAKKLGIPVVADSDTHYCTKEEKIFRDVYIMSQGVGGVFHPLYIRDEVLRLRSQNPNQHLRLTNEMLQNFSWLNDEECVHEMVITNPKKIFDSLEAMRPVPEGTFPPVIEGSDDKLRELCYNTAKEMYEFDGKLPEIVENRLNNELENIIRNGFGVHYYIAHLLVKKSNEDGYVVGSRGSVGSSFTATMSKITEVNPLPPHYLCRNCHYSEWIEEEEIKSGYDLEDKVCPHCGATMKGEGHNIPFQTFLGFNAEKTPDIDLNFSNEYQAKAHAFIKEVFGEDYAYRAGTIGTVAEKTAYGYVSGYCEKMNILDMRRTMRDYLAQGCKNVKRTTGQHPGGIIIIPSDYSVEDFTPVQYPANDPTSDWKTTHYDFHDIHDNVLKFDILGHVDPTAMRLLSTISKTNPLSIPMNDKEALSLFYSDDALKADTRIYHKETGALGLPEFGTRTTRRVLEQTRPHHFSDLVIISGLSHGTDVYAGNAEVLIQKGHPLQEVIGCRDDIMTYLLAKQLEPLDAFKIMEQVRKGKGVDEKQITLMKEHAVPDWYIESCQKIKYMFPKAHAVAYVIMAVRIAWYKVHEPQNFYIQYLTLRCDAYEIETMVKGIEPIRIRMKEIEDKMNNRSAVEKVTNKEKALYDTLEVCEEMYARGYSIGNVDLYQSKATEFTLSKENVHVIIPPFVVIDGLGTNVARSIEEARKEADFLSKEDILKRTQLSQTLIKKLEVLGCLEGLEDKNQLSLF